MKSAEIRKTFLDFFAKKQHEIVQSAPMVVKNDPTLMFINAGMNQFKDLFLGNSPIKYSRIADTQKCLRVSGKHNDLDEVGVDTYHHTMFEMLGNWSFGDYFKEEAISWAWELLTDVYKIDKSRLYVTIFEGDEKDGTSKDIESFNIWKKYITEDRIIEASKKDNFWEMGETGPCGACTEIHVDIRPDSERKQIDGKTLVNEDHPQVIEIWNLVFMEFTRMADGSLKNLPAKHVDTGMGFERLAVVLQGKTSNYDTDVFMPLINKIETITGFKYAATDKLEDVSIRVIADHIRAIAFAIADGQLPSNNGAGYVIRRILRRAVRYAYTYLNTKTPLLFEILPVLVEQMGDYFPELKNQEELISKVIKEEEESFLRALEKGIVKFDDYTKANANKEINGDFAFELYDTYGFPIDLTCLMAEEQNLKVDMLGFEKALEEQKNRSRKATSIENDDWVELLEDDTEEFIGYDYLETNIKITKYRKVTQKNKSFFQLVFNLTPFYAEGGGQVGDKGYIEFEGIKTSIFDTKKENNQILHFVKELPPNPNATFLAKVNTEKRLLTTKNHSATHLLHEALRSVLGTHVEQKGSLVNDEHLRFDFSHFSKVTDEEIIAIEEYVNQKITEHIQLQEHRNTPIEEAKNMGAVALFGEKYGDTVRVIQFADSSELCGGTHVKNTGEISLFKITHETSVAAGVRRIEAITSDKALEYYKNKETVYNQINDLLKNPKNLNKAVEDLLTQNKSLQKQIEQFNKEKATLLTKEIESDIELINNIHFISKVVDLDASSIKDVVFNLKNKYNHLFAVLGTKKGNKPNITVLISEELATNKNLNAGKIVRELAKEIKGGGGGQAFFASAGGKDINGLQIAIDKAIDFIK